MSLPNRIITITQDEDVIMIEVKITKTETWHSYSDDISETLRKLAKEFENE